ncbi:MAG: alpha/beta hydrolase-fold protein [Saprospiraceae bacterium]|nr:alpha/beta hydrolase-fold protein [Saprospiraceae bacterium]
MIGLMIAVAGIGDAQTTRSTQFLSKIGIKDSIYSRTLDAYRTFYIAFPADYGTSQNKQYPVAFVLDGEMLLPTLHEVQRYYSGGFTPEMILVGIDNSKHRVRDLTISSITEKYGMPFHVESGGADKFSDFIEEELIPHIENAYPVTGYRTLIGHSYGGLFAVYTLLQKPELFANYLAIDPSLDWNDQEILAEARDALAGKMYTGKSLFMSLSGQLHLQNSDITIDNVMQDQSDFTLFARSNLALKEMIEQDDHHGLTFHWQFYPDDLHGTIAFPSMMDGLIRLFQWYQMENTDKINDFDTPQDALYDVVKHREQKLRAHFGYPEPPYPEELLNFMGHMNLEMGQPAKAKMYFEFGIQYYPQSANAYDSLAEYYEVQGDTAKALELVRQAAKLSDDRYFQERIRALRKKE